MTTYLSRILGQPVWDAQGQRLGQCVDVLVAEGEPGFPPLRALVVSQGKKDERLISAEAIAWLSPSIILNSSTPPVYTLRGDELWLGRQVMDRQIVDTEDRRLVRVNDLQLARVGNNGHYCLAGANVGTRSLLRRLGVDGVTEKVSKAFRRDLPDTVISWKDVAPLQADAPIRLRVSRDKISELHPADIAAIVTELDRPMGEALLKTLDNEIVADTIQEIEPELQVTMLGTLSPERAADILEEMDPDDAADLLADLQPTERDTLLELMEDEDANDVEKLLAYPEDSAGGIMTTEYATIPLGLTVEQAMAHLRRSAEAREDEALYYLYLVDEQGVLHGVLSLRDLVLADPEVPVQAIADDHPVTVAPLTPQNEVARLVAKYNLLAVPVVDENGVLHGIVTVDDAIDAIIPTAWKKHLPHFF